MTITPATVTDIYRLLDDYIKLNNESDRIREESPQQYAHLKNNLCIWGAQGNGKTQIVAHYAAQNNLHFVRINPQENEEVGDFQGMPDRLNGETVMLPPSWVPKNTDGRGGILLIDDFNRANPVILQALMRLIQSYEFGTWKLPKGWNIVLTANPEDAGFDVNNLDKAQFERMSHVYFKFDVNIWANWATSCDIDERLINFLIMNKEFIKEEKGTYVVSPRTYTMLCNQLSLYKDFKDPVQRRAALFRAQVTLNSPEHVAMLKQFMEEELDQLQSIETLMKSKNPDLYINELILNDKGELVRTDILNLYMSRLNNFIISGKIIEKGKVSEQYVSNIEKLFKMKHNKPDLIYNTCRIMNEAATKHVAIRNIFKNSTVINNELIKALS